MAEKSGSKHSKAPTAGGKSAVRSHIEAAIEAARAEHKREHFRRRVEIARQGVRNYNEHKMGDAARAFHTYLQILEEWKGVPEGGLSPALFDREKELPELLVISGVYWDLVKLYDRTKSPERQKAFRQYLEKYVIFARGTSFEPIAAETLRKYIGSHKPVHSAEFKNAYKVLAGSNRCFVATALFDVCDPRTPDRLRAFRDGTLRRNPQGRAFIAWYYRSGPAIAAATERFPYPFRRAMGVCLDALATALSAAGFRSGRAGR